MKSRTKQTTTSAVATTSTTKNSATAQTCETQSKAYPSISAAYWLPATNSTPYLLPGDKKSQKLISLS